MLVNETIELLFDSNEKKTKIEFLKPYTTYNFKLIGLAANQTFDTKELNVTTMPDSNFNWKKNFEFILNKNF